MRKEAERDEEDTIKRKINQEADDILRKDMQELEARHRVHTHSFSKRPFFNSAKTVSWEWLNLLRTYLPANASQ